MPLRSRGAPAALMLLLTACGSTAATGSAPCTATPAPTRASPSAGAGGITVTADAELVAPGATVTFDVRLLGPLHLHTDCAAPLSLVVVDAGGVHVFEEAPPAARGTPCGDVTLAAGQRSEAELQWTPDTTLPSGVYTAVVTVGDQAPLTLHVLLGRRSLEPCG